MQSNEKASRSSSRELVQFLTALIFAGAIASPSLAQPPSPADSDCMTCHEDGSLRGSTGKSLFVDLEAFKRSLHGQVGITCVSCHSDLKAVRDFPHKEKLASAVCHDCHEKAQTSFRNSIHARGQTKLGGRTLSCSDCHDAHNIVARSNPASPISPFRAQELCLKCHGNATPETKGRRTDFVASYEKSVHAKALKKAGLNVAATCVSCHGSHDVRIVSDPASPVARENIPSTCGSCHGGILADYKQSIHGAGFLAGKKEMPVCTDCHGEHTVQSATVPSSKTYASNVPETCGRCHEDHRLVQQFNLATKRIASFESSFHGVALRFGELTVANCASCHGYHHILPQSNPHSTVHPANIPKTCGQCHANAGTNWARGKVHVAEPITDNYWVYLTQKLYIIGIGGSMGLFLLFIFADLWGWRRRSQEERNENR
jgi:Cytochrome c3